MALLEKPQARNPFGEELGDELPAAGTFGATIIGIADEFGIERPKYEKPEEIETVDLTTFLFGYRDGNGNAHRITSKRMRISGHEKSSLYQMLTSILGRPPEYGWDYCELKGKQCLVTVSHVPRRDGNGVFASIVSLSPLPQGMQAPAAQPVMQAPPQPQPAAVGVVEAAPQAQPAGQVAPEGPPAVVEQQEEILPF